MHIIRIRFIRCDRIICLKLILVRRLPLRCRIEFGLIYLITSLVIVLLVKFVPINISFLQRGILFGCGAGFFLYLVAFSFGITFYASPSIDHILFDLSWQTIEGGLGGAVVGGTYAIVSRVMRFSQN